jgi:benzoyl-CoA reductase/2-hydroxyglutaryl-CoA dehydratase subunit BcrC/BadD/HgdB
MPRERTRSAFSEPGNLYSGQTDIFRHIVVPLPGEPLKMLWRLNTTFDFFADVVLPVKLDTASSREYLEDVLRKFKKDLESWRGRQIADEALNRSIDIYNTIRNQLGTLYRLRSEDPGTISGSDVATVVKGSMIMEREHLPERLERLIEEVKEGRYATEGGTDKKRLIIAGSICDHPDFYRLLERSGGIVVGDDLCTGGRYFEGIIEGGSDPIAAIAGRYATRPICPAKHLSNRARGEALIATVKKHRAQGVIFLLLKFCDPHAFDYPYLKEMLEKESIPSIVIEVEDQLPPEGQLHTRFETFIHML